MTDLEKKAAPESIYKSVTGESRKELRKATIDVYRNWVELVLPYLNDLDQICSTQIKMGLLNDPNYAMYEKLIRKAIQSGNELLQLKT